MHPGVLVQPDRPRQVLGVDVQRGARHASSAKCSKRVAKQREAEPSPPPRTADAEDVYVAETGVAGGVLPTQAHARDRAAVFCEEPERRVESRPAQMLGVPLRERLVVMLPVILERLHVRLVNALVVFTGHKRPHR